MAQTEGSLKRGEETLSREEMEQAIDEGGSVLHEGRIIRTKKELKRALQTEEEIDQEIEDLNNRKEEVKANRAAKPAARKK